MLQVPQVPALHNLENVAGGTCDNPQAAPSLINQIDPIAQKSEETVQLKELPSRDGGGKRLNASDNSRYDSNCCKNGVSG